MKTTSLYAYQKRVAAFARGRNHLGMFVFY